MLSTHRLLLLALVAPFALVACGGGGGDDDDDPVIPEGTHHGYVVSKTSVLAVAPNQPNDPGFGLDLGSKTSSEPDGKIDNNLGFALAIISDLDEEGSLNVDTTLATAINEGSVIMLVDFQSKDFANSNAGFSTKFGINPNPPACSSDMTCGHHLMGGASFEVATDSPRDALVTGKLENGTFDGKGKLSLQITIGSTDPILIPLVRARVKVTSVSETSLKALVAGLISAEDFRTHVGGALQVSLGELQASVCTDPTSPPGCGCVGLAGELLKLLDSSPSDCQVSIDEILAFPGTAAFTSPDGCSKDTCSAADAISVGLNIEAVAATFPM
jgi:hypothetical protein